MQINLILATDNNSGIGKNNKIPWYLKNDIKYFKEITSKGDKNAVIMGRNTWDSIPKSYKPLKNRLNIVLSKNVDELEYGKDVIVKRSNEDAITFCEENKINTVWIIGGKTLYEYFLNEKKFDYMYITKIYQDFECDKKIDNLNEILSENVLIGNTNIKSENNILHQYFIYGNSEKIQISKLHQVIFSENMKFDKHPDISYLKLIEDILENGSNRQTRNGETISLFGSKIEMNLKNGFPLLTSKKVFWRGILHELLWFINADTNSKNLEEKKVNIWKGNTENSYLEKLDLPYEDGIGGPIYGWQWRKFNQQYEYKNKNTGDLEIINGSENGFDQLQFIINEIKENPNSRRLFMSAWNPVQMGKMCLPPCHVSYQFYVGKDGLSCQMYQRSADVFLGLPFNIASTATLTQIIAHHCNLEVDKLIICIGDAHIYTDHLEAIKKQLYLDKPIYSLSKLEITNRYENINDYKFEDFSLKEYRSNETIKAKMLS